MVGVQAVMGRGEMEGAGWAELHLRHTCSSSWVSGKSLKGCQQG